MHSYIGSTPHPVTVANKGLVLNFTFISQLRCDQHSDNFGYIMRVVHGYAIPRVCSCICYIVYVWEMLYMLYMLYNVFDVLYMVSLSSMCVADVMYFTYGVYIMHIYI